MILIVSFGLKAMFTVNANKIIKIHDLIIFKNP